MHRLLTICVLLIVIMGVFSPEIFSKRWFTLICIISKNKCTIIIMVIPLRKIKEMPHLADIFLDWRILRECRPNCWLGQTFMCVCIYVCIQKGIYMFIYFWYEFIFFLDRTKVKYALKTKLSNYLSYCLMMRKKHNHILRDHDKQSLVYTSENMPL